MSEDHDPAAEPDVRDHPIVADIRQKLINLKPDDRPSLTAVIRANEVELQAALERGCTYPAIAALHEPAYPKTGADTVRILHGRSGPKRPAKSQKARNKAGAAQTTVPDDLRHAFTNKIPSPGLKSMVVDAPKDIEPAHRPAAETWSTSSQPCQLSFDTDGDNGPLGCEHPSLVDGLAQATSSLMTSPAVDDAQAASSEPLASSPLRSFASPDADIATGSGRADVAVEPAPASSETILNTPARPAFAAPPAQAREPFAAERVAVSSAETERKVDDEADDGFGDLAAQASSWPAGRGPQPRATAAAPTLQRPATIGWQPIPIELLFESMGSIMRIAPLPRDGSPGRANISEQKPHLEDRATPPQHGAVYPDHPSSAVHPQLGEADSRQPPNTVEHHNASPPAGAPGTRDPAARSPAAQIKPLTQPVLRGGWSVGPTTARPRPRADDLGDGEA